MTAEVYHADLWGLREVREKDAEGETQLTGGKYQWLYENELNSTRWKQAGPQSPFYLFVPQDTGLRLEYEQAWKPTDAIPVNVLGFQTHRDDFAVDFDRDHVRHRIAEMRCRDISDRDFAEKYGVTDNRDWKLEKARRALRASEEWEASILECLYRPFDKRYCYFSEVAMDFPRRQLLDHVAGRPNLCIGLGRQGIAVSDPQWALISISRDPIDANIFRRGGINVFPLYLYSRNDENYLFHLHDRDDAPAGRQPNLAPEFVEELGRRVKLTFVPDARRNLKNTFGPEDVFHYMYAAFHSPTYRSRYAEFLKIDFPRLPLTSKRPLFRALCRLGEELTGLHLMEKHGAPITQYPVAGDNRVEKVRYTEPGQGAPTGRVWINKEQFFDNVPPHVWDFHIGGYQVCQKWLKDRKKRQLTYDDLTHYQNIVSALAETIRLMAEIDQTIEKHGGWPLG